MTERNVNCSTSTYIHPTSLYIVSKAFLVIVKEHVVKSMKLEMFVFLITESPEHTLDLVE